MPKNAVLAAAPSLDEDRLAWLALVLAPGLGPKRILDAVRARIMAETNGLYPAPIAILDCVERGLAGAASARRWGRSEN